MLELIPNSKKDVRKEIPKIHMWVDEGNWLPVQQKFFEGSSGDYFLSRYRNLMKNLKIQGFDVQAGLAQGYERKRSRAGKAFRS